MRLSHSNNYLMNTFLCVRSKACSKTMKRSIMMAIKAIDTSIKRSSNDTMTSQSLDILSQIILQMSSFVIANYYRTSVESFINLGLRTMK